MLKYLFEFNEFTSSSFTKTKTGKYQGIVYVFNTSTAINIQDILTILSNNNKKFSFYFIRDKVEKYLYKLLVYDLKNDYTIEQLEKDLLDRYIKITVNKPLINYLK